MRSGRNIIGIIAAGIAGAWFVTGLVINANWTTLHGDEITRSLGMPASPMLVSAALWTVVVYFAAVNVMLPIAPRKGSVLEGLRTLGNRLHDSIVADDDLEDDDSVMFDDMPDDRVDEPMHPGHWLGARVVALAAVAITFIVCEGVDMVKPALAHPAAAVSYVAVSNGL